MKSARITPIILVVAVIASVTANAVGNPKEAGFTAQCTDTSGTTFDVSNFVFNYVFSYPTPGWIGRTSWSRNNPRTFIPFSHHGFIVRIPFKQINTVDFVDVSQEWPEERPIKLDLRDGSSLTGGFGRYGSSAGFKGNTELGEFELSVNRVKKIQFLHKPIDDKRTDASTGEKRSEYTLTIQTWNDKELTINNGFLFKINYDGICSWDSARNRYKDQTTAFSLKVGEAKQEVPFDNVKQLVFRAETPASRGGYIGDAWVEVTTVSGKTIEASMPRLLEFHVGGNIEKFGSGWIHLRRVRSISVTN